MQPIKLFRFVRLALLLLVSWILLLSLSAEAQQYPGGIATAPLFWVKANTGITQSGNLVSAWADQSTNSNNLVQGTTAAMPVYDPSAANFNPTVSFNGSQWLSKSTGIFLNGPVYSASDAYAVCTETFPKSTRGLYGQYVTMTGNATIARWMSHGPFNATFNYFGVGVTSDPSQWGTYNPNRADSVSTLWTWTYASSVNTLRYNGGTGSGSGNTLASFTGAGTAFCLGAAPYEGGGTPNYYTQLGTIPELIIFSSALSAADRNKVETYLSIKYGVTMGGHNYLNTASATVYDISTYGNAVAGIGRENVEALHQKQSKSAAPGALVTIGLGTIAVDNNSNPNSLTDGTYMIWGDNAGANAWQTTASPANRKRLTRQWKLQETGTVGSVLVRIPASTSTLATKLPAESNLVYLLTDADGDFSSGSTETAMTLNGTNWEANIDFTNGQFFTFATQNITLPVSLASFSAGVRSGTCLVNWTTASEANSDHFEIEHSTDGIGYNTIGSVPAKGNRQSLSQYSFTDRSPAQGLNYYRLKQVDMDGKSVLSGIMKISFDESRLAGLVISPNPVLQNRVNISLLNAPAGRYSVLLYNSNGQLQLNSTLQHNGSPDAVGVSLPASLPKGVYTLQLKNGTVVLKRELIKE